jgi:hypothetical protein|tara:strand:- start:29 stop:253 length:225 start_codon:yes stop_codon:yes gene_type:complete
MAEVLVEPIDFALDVSRESLLVLNRGNQAASAKNPAQVSERGANALPVPVDARPTLTSWEMLIQKITDKLFAEV